MTLWELALRSAAFWLIGQFGLGLGSAFAATQRLPFFWSLLAIAAFKLCIMVGCFGLALLGGRAFMTDNGLGEARFLAATVFVFSLWLSFVALQYVQNLFYRAVDVPPQPIRWFGWQEKGKRKRKGGRL